MATFYNQATLSYNGITTTSNITAGEILSALTASKTAVRNSYAGGDRITYVISLVNSGATQLTGLALTDNLGEYEYNETSLYPLDYVEDSVKYYVNGELQPAPAVTAGPPLTVSGITVPAGGNSAIVYETAVNEYAPLNTQDSLVNTVTVSGGNLSEAVTAQETVTPMAGAVLSISKSLSPLVVSDSDRLTYTFVIQNTGNTPVTVQDTASITDTFDPVLRNISVAFNGTPWTSPENYSYNETTGLFTIANGQITVPAATYSRSATGEVVVTPGTSTLTVSGTI